MRKFDKEDSAINAVIESIRSYFFKPRPLNTLDWTIKEIKRNIMFRLSKQKLQEIFNEFERYKYSRCIELIERCKEEDLL